jgi:hypothetical protein
MIILSTLNTFPLWRMSVFAYPLNLAPGSLVIGNLILENGIFNGLHRIAILKAFGTERWVDNPMPAERREGEAGTSLVKN